MLRTDDIGPEEEDILNFLRFRDFRRVVSRTIAIHGDLLLIVVGRSCSCGSFAQLGGLPSGLTGRHFVGRAIAVNCRTGRISLLDEK